MLAADKMQEIFAAETAIKRRGLKRRILFGCASLRKNGIIEKITEELER